jgi:hypothetical protein
MGSSFSFKKPQARPSVIMTTRRSQLGLQNPQARQHVDVDSMIHRLDGRCIVSSRFESDSPILSPSNLAATPPHLLLSYTSVLALESRVNDFSRSTGLREPVDQQWLAHLNQEGHREGIPNREEHRNTFHSCVYQLAEFNQEVLKYVSANAISMQCCFKYTKYI